MSGGRQRRDESERFGGAIDTWTERRGGMRLTPVLAADRVPRALAPVVRLDEVFDHFARFFRFPPLVPEPVAESHPFLTRLGRRRVELGRVEGCARDDGGRDERGDAGEDQAGSLGASWVST